MPFTGVHVSYGVIDEIGRSSDVYGKTVWSETFAANAVIKTTARPADLNTGSLRTVFMVQPSMDVFVAVGATPDASASPRSLILAGERVLIPCTYGDKLAWVAA